MGESYNFGHLLRGVRRLGVGGGVDSDGDGGGGGGCGGGGGVVEMVVCVQLYPNLFSLVKYVSL